MLALIPKNRKKYLGNERNSYIPSKLLKKKILA